MKSTKRKTWNSGQKGNQPSRVDGKKPQRKLNGVEEGNPSTRTKSNQRMKSKIADA